MSDEPNVSAEQADEVAQGAEEVPSSELEGTSGESEVHGSGDFVELPEIVAGEVPKKRQGQRGRDRKPRKRSASAAATESAAPAVVLPVATEGDGRPVKPKKAAVKVVEVGIDWSWQSNGARPVRS